MPQLYTNLREMLWMVLRVRLGIVCMNSSFSLKNPIHRVACRINDHQHLESEVIEATNASITIVVVDVGGLPQLPTTLQALIAVAKTANLLI